MKIIAHKMLALKPLKAKEKAETTMAGNIALVSQKVNVIEAELAMDFQLANGTVLVAGKDKVILSGEAAYQGFAKQIFSYSGVEFFRVNEDMIYGYIKGE